MESFRQLALIEESFNTQYSPSAREALNSLAENFTITDPNISGHPIVFASSGFLKMTGYSRAEVIGQNGRMFQGPETSRSSVLEIREAVREERTVEMRLLNHRKDGSPFWVLFYMGPVFGAEDGRVVNFIAVQVPLVAKQRRNGAVCEDQVFFGSCRMEVCCDADLSRVTGSGSDCRGLGNEELCGSSDLERRLAATAFNKILSVLTQYSESTGRLVCGRRCSLPRAGLHSSSLNFSLGRIKQSFVLTDPHLPDMPIVYASDAFLKLTGYARDEVLGRNCRFLSGADTDPLVLLQIKECIQAEIACTVRILNYRKDRRTFWNLLHTSPVRNATGKIAYFVGVQIEEGCKNHDHCGLSPEMRQLSTVGAVKVAVRSSSMNTGSSSS